MSIKSDRKIDSREIDSVAFIERYCAEASTVAASVARQSGKISQIVETLLASIRRGGRIYTCGNGGSACDAMHLAEELVARYLRERPGIRAQHLIDSGTITCWANDYHFDDAFARQVETLMNPEDVLAVFTTSGNSTNCIRAVETAKKIGGTTIAFTGKDGGKVLSLADHHLLVESRLTSHIQEAHVILLHIICDLVEQKLFPDAK